MKHLIYILLPALLLINTAGVNAEKMNVIINNKSNIESIDANTIRKIFLGKPVTLKDSEKLIPVDLLESDTNYAAFYAQVVKKNRAQVASYWSRKLFTGTGKPPKQFKNNKDVLEWIQKNVDSIGYVSGEIKSSKVKIIYSFES